MTPEEFAFVVEHQTRTCIDMLTAKADEYATDDDRLHNFKVAAGLQDVSAAQALAGMMAKHTVSIYDMIEARDQSYPDELWIEKITDHINYLILLRAIITEQKVYEMTIANPMTPQGLK